MSLSRGERARIKREMKRQERERQKLMERMKKEKHPLYEAVHKRVTNVYNFITRTRWSRFFGPLFCVSMFFWPVKGTGYSMEPVMQNNKWWMAYWHYRWMPETVQRWLIRPTRVGDVVGFMLPFDATNSAAKTVVGLAGDWVDVGDAEHNSMVYASDSTDVPAGAVCIPKGHVWVEGHNPLFSTDSRIYGPIPEGLIQYRILGSLMPPKSIQINEDDFMR